MELQLEQEALQHLDMDRLAGTCPRCFGAVVPGKTAIEPTNVVCIDGNFQQRRHLAASVEQPGAFVDHPALFLPPSKVVEWEKILLNTNQAARGQADPEIEVCLSASTISCDGQKAQKEL